MSTHIHVVIEHRSHKSIPDTWIGMFQSQYWDQYYPMFGLMANVRIPKPQGFQPKGFPDNLSWSTIRCTHFYVVDDINDLIHDGVVIEKNGVMRHVAEKWAKGREDLWLNYNYICDPDIHTPSWLSLEELKKIRNLMAATSAGLNATIAAMESLEHDNHNTRLVFWFEG